MAERVSVAPGRLAWARGRSGRTIDDLAKGFPKLADWEAGTLQPTVRQLENYAQATHTPFGFFFLPEVPSEVLPIPDMRTFGNQAIRTPTPDLLDTIYICEQRRDWYRSYAEENGVDRVSFVGSQSTADSPVRAASQLRELLKFEVDSRPANWTDALDRLRENAESIGILVMISGVVGNNTHRVLNPEEFRGFALADEYAPIVFINGKDTKAAQIFTLAHGFAHVSLGGSALSRPDLGRLGESDSIERWCNSVAAEMLVPANSVRRDYRDRTDISSELDRLARVYKVSTLVLLRRLLDVGLISEARFRIEYPAELRRVLELSSRPKASGGSFYNTEPIRVSRTFARAILMDTVEGRTQHREAFRLLGFKKLSTFNELSHRLGVA